MIDTTEFWIAIVIVVVFIYAPLYYLKHGNLGP